MFTYTIAFNSNISEWTISKVSDINSMFAGCAIFNQPLLWDVSNVTNMSFMFSGCRAFNQDISSWIVTSVTNMSYMF